MYSWLIFWPQQWSGTQSCFAVLAKVGLYWSLKNHPYEYHYSGFSWSDCGHKHLQATLVYQTILYPKVGWLARVCIYHYLIIDKLGTTHQYLFRTPSALSS